jgi:hypothetical protein
MTLINHIDRLLSNIRTVEHYLVDGTGEEKHAIRELIRKGKCLVAYKMLNETRFAPSRFLGYVDNNLKKHMAAKQKHEVDGKETNPAISKVLNQQLLRDENLETEYIRYCSKMGLIPLKYNRTYWRLTKKIF